MFAAMAVLLEAIRFTHDPGSTTSAVRLRRNAADAVFVPEWRRGVSFRPEDAPAAYAVARARIHPVTIQAQIRRTDPTIERVEVRAVDRAHAAAGGCLYAVLHGLGLAPAPPPPAVGSVLGDLKARSITFDGGDVSDFETFELPAHELGRAGVGVHSVSWTWQYRKTSFDAWTDFETSSHEVFTLLDVPTAPWQQTPDDSTNTQLPWIDLLRHACAWAGGACTRDDAARHITAAFHALAPAKLEFDVPGGGSTRYAHPVFNATAFLDRLTGGFGNGPYVNATDCATIISTFANALGCDLWQSRMGYEFSANPVRMLGSDAWSPACGWGGLAFHEVAWSGEAGADDDVWDGSLQVDGDSDPTAQPHLPLLPVKSRFGGVYRDRLVAPATRASCAPRPASRDRRPVI
jgi:hypothetical protein